MCTLLTKLIQADSGWYADADLLIESPWFVLHDERSPPLSQGFREFREDRDRERETEREKSRHKFLFPFMVACGLWLPYAHAMKKLPLTRKLK